MTDIRRVCPLYERGFAFNVIGKESRVVPTRSKVERSVLFIQTEIKRSRSASDRFIVPSFTLLNRTIKLVEERSAFEFDAKSTFSYVTDPPP